MKATRNSGKRHVIILSVLAAVTSALMIPETTNAETPAPKATADATGHIVLPTRKDTLPYSDGVLVGNTLYLSGRIGVDPETGKAPQELEKEIRLLLDG